MDYNILINQLLKITVDKLCPPKIGIVYEDKLNYGRFKDSTTEEKLFSRRFIEIGKYNTRTYPYTFYISKQVSNKYPFILKGFFNKHRSYYYRRIKNPHYPKIDVFYGLRDLYKNKFTSENYYNEVVEYNNCICSRSARIINKIQGVTYYLANKERLYLKLLQHYPREQLYYHPKSIIIKNINNVKLCSPIMIENIRNLENFLNTNEDIHKFIIKPCNGSQGKGIKVVETRDVYSMVNEMIEIQKVYDYDSFLISSYIDNPKLHCLMGDKDGGRKFNIRYYVLLFLENNQLFVYYLNRQIIYYSLLEYNPLSTVDVSYGNATAEDIQKMRSLTNLQIVTDMNTKYKWSLKTADYLDVIENIVIQESLLESIHSQFFNICRQTINATRKEFRSLNRFISGNVSFNLIAYDTLLDDKDRLHLIEINRGADLVGLQRMLGEQSTTEIFTELFDICIDGKISHFKYFFPVDLDNHK
jgi:hypothetical protein